MPTHVALPTLLRARAALKLIRFMPPTNSKSLLTVVLLCVLLLASPFSGLAQQDTTNVYRMDYVKNDVWITVQLNFLEFKKEDEQYFHSLLDALKIEDVTK
jgi:hypothetical protein